MSLFTCLHFLLGVVLCATAATGYSPSPTTDTDALAQTALENLGQFAAANSNSTTCRLENAVQRKEWGSLSVAERTNYTDAVLCLMAAPSRFNNSAAVPGAKSRYDDFVVAHMNQTATIHGTANFLAWHRYFVAAFEAALRAECGYAGAQPYWNWGRWAADPARSPLFDDTPGAAGTLSGNGAPAPHQPTDALRTGLSVIPPGDGGGCVTTGPFANYTVNLGPVAPTLRLLNGSGGVAPLQPVTPKNLFAHNPRCMRRDISSFVSSHWTTDQNTTDLILGHDDVVSFQDAMQGDPTKGDYGVHGGGHFTIQGDPAGDIYVSPADPAFYLHHAQVDRVWWIWQNQAPAARTTAFGGLTTYNVTPPGPPGTLDDVLDMGLNAEPMRIARAMSTVGTTGGPFCYVYV